ncbi:hypothetical protein Dda_4250 [Drechslerella dactyloides]|uniref:HhH-GPD domain-containing protein n=1 Tax=Drechslerella dactyloides TaxID=74499 RepID=A0AAD6NKP5_DREDA|nr:hypothetical protein Dda_4250 [Drechslerella dactyloides]
MSLLSEPVETDAVTSDSQSKYFLTSTASPGFAEDAALQLASAEPARSRNGNKRNLEGETDTERHGADEWSKQQPQENTSRKRRKQHSSGAAATAAIEDQSIGLPIYSGSLETSETVVDSIPPEDHADEPTETAGLLPPRRKRDTAKTPIISGSNSGTRRRKSVSTRQQGAQSDGRLCLSSDSAFVETSPYFSQPTLATRRSSRSRTKTLLSIPASSDMIVPGTPEIQRQTDRMYGLGTEDEPQHGTDDLGPDSGELAAAEPGGQSADKAPVGSSIAPSHLSSPAEMPLVGSRRGAKSVKQEPDPELYKDFDFREYTRYVFSKDKGTVSVEQALENIRNHGKWDVSSAVEGQSKKLDSNASTGTTIEHSSAAVEELTKAPEDPKDGEQHQKSKHKKRKSKREDGKEKSKDEKRKKKKKRKESDSKDGTEHTEGADTDGKKKRHHRKERKHDGDHEEKRSKHKERKRERERLKGTERAQQEETEHLPEAPNVGTEASINPHDRESDPGDETPVAMPTESSALEPNTRGRKATASKAKKSSKEASTSRITVAVPAPGDGGQIVDETPVADEVEEPDVALAENRRPRKRRVQETAAIDSKKARVVSVASAEIEGSEIVEHDEQSNDVDLEDEVQQTEHSLSEEIEVTEIKRTSRKRAQSSTRLKSLSASPSKRIPAGTSIIVPPPLDAPRFGLIQEEVRDNPYHLLVAVIFLQKTKGSSAIPVFRDFISKWPTPAELLSNGSEEEVKKWFVPLGLQATRAKSVWNIARHFSQINPDDRLPGPDIWVPRSDYVPEDPTGAKRKWGCVIGSIPGCGKYAIDSWRIFCMKPGQGGFLDGTVVGSRRRQEIPTDEESLPTVLYPSEFALGDEEWRRIPVDDPKLDKELKAYVQWMHAKDTAGFGTLASALPLNDRDAEGEPDDWLEHGASASFV